MRLFPIFCAALAVTAAAEPSKLTRGEATDLYVALINCEAGLNPANTVAAADDINALRPAVEAIDKGKVAAQRTLRALAKAAPADAEKQAERITDELQAKIDELVTVDLTPLAISDEELTAAKMKPATLSILRRWLNKPKPKSSP